ncbi:IS66 family transposase [Lyngbya confervoides]|uniref:IS66 family transposase n=1 Tax=Lyngbya confervoides BDU141951 TaxID=1574623 RepID=A0ABD4T7A4_9CYAN|nr:IS66 family transposase [Lyngbya confervoides]MCM1984609.1 IS66 family transposase [Lyngbya confervoides BDU141951]
MSTTDECPNAVSNEGAPEEKGAAYWYEQYRQQREENERLRTQINQMAVEIEQLKETLKKLTNRNSRNSSQPPSADAHKKPGKAIKRRKKKQGPKYGHPGTTRNGFERIDQCIELGLELCPVCGKPLAQVDDAPLRRHQIAELVSQPVEVTEYVRPAYQCPECDWKGYAELPVGCREDFSYGGMLSSVVGWLGYGGHLSWLKQRYLVETVFGIPLSQGSLAKMHQWFCESLYPSYERWWQYIQSPGVRCVDETSYRLDGVNYWMWVATSETVCVLFLAPTRSSKEVKSLLGDDFSGILSSDCWSAYGLQEAAYKQKCLAHIERELVSLASSRFAANRYFAQQVFIILHSARQAYQQYHDGEISWSQLATFRVVVEAELAHVLDHPLERRWPTDAQKLAQRFERHWDEWFTFLSHPEVKPDNNDAERALRPVVVHRKVSGGARSHWGGQLVAMMFSFLETMRLQGKNAVQELFNLLSSSGLPPPEP